MILGHRGAASLAPENTLPSMQKAVEAGADGIEIDVQLSADKIPVIFHDDTLDRTTNSQGLLSLHSLDELKKVDAGSWFSEEFKSATVPTLEEALIFCQKNNLTMNLEIKISTHCEINELVKQVVAVIQKTNFPLDKLFCSSFSLPALKQLYKLYPGVRRGLISDDDITNLPEIAKQMKLFSVHMAQKNLNKAMAKSIKELGLILVVWTLNDPSKVDKFTKWGVDHFITDKPNEF